MSVFKIIKSMFGPVPRCAPADGAARVRDGTALLVDVREPAEWAGGFAESAALLPMSDLNGARTQWKKFLAEANGREILLYCGAGVRSGMAARILVAEGHRATNTGSLTDWLESGWKITQRS